MEVAIIRPVSRCIQDCELTHLNRVDICHQTAQQQHDAYSQALTTLGVQVVELPALHNHADAVFVEDTVVVVDEVAVLTRLGAQSRRGESASMLECISRFRKVVQIQAPGTLEGGDVMQVGRTIYVGRSTRSNEAGIEQLRAYLAPYGYDTVTVEAPGALHLKTACTCIGPDTLLANANWIDVNAFNGLHVIEAHPDEPFAGNAVQVGETLIFSKQYPETARRLRDSGFTLVLVDSTELAKAEGSLTCKSVLLRRTQ